MPSELVRVMELMMMVSGRLWQKVGYEGINMVDKRKRKARYCETKVTVEVITDVGCGSTGGRDSYITLRHSFT